MPATCTGVENQRAPPWMRADDGHRTHLRGCVHHGIEHAGAVDTVTCGNHVGGVGAKSTRSSVEQRDVPLAGDVERMCRTASQRAADDIEGFTTHRAAQDIERPHDPVETTRSRVA